MPTYNYRCTECGHEIERILKMADYKLPESEPCPECGKEGTVKQYLAGAVHVGDPFALGKVKLNDGMKNVLDKVRQAPGASHVRSRFEDL